MWSAHPFGPPPNLNALLVWKVSIELQSHRRWEKTTWRLHRIRSRWCMGYPKMLLAEHTWETSFFVISDHFEKRHTYVSYMNDPEHRSSGNVNPCGENIITFMTFLHLDRNVKKLSIWKEHWEEWCVYLKRVSEQDYEGFFRKQNFTVMKSSLHVKAQQPNMWPPYLQ